MKSGMSEKAQGLIEYCLILAVASLAVIILLSLFGPEIQEAVSSIAANLFPGR